MINSKKKKKPEASNADDSFDYDQGYNIEEVYDQWVHKKQHQMVA